MPYEVIMNGIYPLSYFTPLHISYISQTDKGGNKAAVAAERKFSM
jgi:hypothetical protein